MREAHCHLQASAPQSRQAPILRPLICILALSAAGLLTGCRVPDPRAPFTDTRPPPGLATRFYPPHGWAWGLIRAGKAPPARYGVSAPAGRQRADVLILASYGEPAEVWFETAADLNARGDVVWVLEPTGQGGSGHYALPRDLVHAPSLAPDVEAVAAMAVGFIGRRPLILIASPTAGPVAVRALERGLQPDGVVLVSPVLTPAPGRALLMRSLGLGGVRAAGGSAWSRQGPDDRALGLTHDAERGRLRLAWQTANPDLRSGGPSWAWRAAFANLQARAADGSMQAVAAPVLVTAPSGQARAAANLCRRLRHCMVRSFAGAGTALPLEADGIRRPWLDAVSRFIEARTGGFAPAPPAA